jgi:mannose-1-phosphate guanylyltransferase/mannose-6-phosphate isomerase
VKTIPIILAGGEGSRLYPLSTPDTPKQFINLIGEKSLFQQTCLRLNSNYFENPIVVGQHKHRFIIAQQLEEIGIEAQAIILEPELKNTAPSIAAAILWIKHHQGSLDVNVGVFPSDHYIDSSTIDDVMHALVKSGDVFTASSAANCLASNIIVLGIKPDCATTEYGYIKATPAQNAGIFQVERFIEKPNKKIAEKLLCDPSIYWNSGMLFATGAALELHFKKWLPQCFDLCKISVTDGTKDLDFYRLEHKSFGLIDAISFDYGVLEHSDTIQMLPLSAKWDDLGRWESLSKYWASDKFNNRANANCAFNDSKNCIAFSLGKSIVVDGFDDLTIIEGAETILVSNQQHVAVKPAAKTTNAKNNVKKQSMAFVGQKVYRPWGWFEYLILKNNYIVKRIWLKSGGQISLQHHLYRDEHWTVVEGTVTAMLDGSELILNTGESTFVKRGQIHRLSNPSNQPCTILEVQTGDDLRESDIIRHHDIYARLD